MVRDLTAAQTAWLRRHLSGRHEVRFDDVTRALSAQTVDALPDGISLARALRAAGWRKDREVHQYGEKQIFYVEDWG
ncbi:hypothetical protein [Sphingomonas sp. ERG5]|uniref:hypothetical protein n=1 Tax=Sphingomonas sp. ERG5 TaxID=1381597 RepID=UPI00054B897F|nr:hypothetical protein [Sphingomonas sp. ERG5]